MEHMKRSKNNPNIFFLPTIIIFKLYEISCRKIVKGINNNPVEIKKYSFS
jgi:hypothetical protein